MRLMAAFALLVLGCGSAQAAVPPAYGYGQSKSALDPILDLRALLGPSGGPTFTAQAMESPPTDAEFDAVLTAYHPSTTPGPRAAGPSRAPRSAEQYTVQLGAFSVRENAEKLLQKAKRALRAGEARIEDSQSGPRPLHVVRFGAYASRKSAERARQRAIDAGLAGAIIALIP